MTGDSDSNRYAALLIGRLMGYWHGNVKNNTGIKLNKITQVVEIKQDARCTGKNRSRRYW